MQKPQLSIRISKESMDKLQTLMNTRKLKKPEVIEAALDLLYNGENAILHPASQIVADEEIARNQIAFKENLEEITNTPSKEPAFHLGGDIKKRNNRYHQQGERAGVKKPDEKVNIRDVMRAFRNKAKGRVYDKEQEKNFHLLTDDFKSRVQ